MSSHAAFVVVIGLGLCACEAPSRSTAAARRESTTLSEAVAAPSPADQDATCTDLGASRVCWANGVARIAPRPLPAIGEIAGGWRCGGQGDGRTCIPRAQNVGPFACDGARCTQRHPRFPDDGEWECADLDGVTICHGGAAPAAIPAAPADLGWSCGTRTGAHHDERVCVDLDPGTPSNPSSDWACEWSHDAGERRVCVRRTAHAIGAACRAASDCPAQAACNAGICIPARFAPACWFAWDCGPGRACRFGTCFEGHS